MGLAEGAGLLLSLTCLWKEERFQYESCIENSNVHSLKTQWDKRIMLTLVSS